MKVSIYQCVYERLDYILWTTMLFWQALNSSQLGTQKSVISIHKDHLSIYLSIDRYFHLSIYLSFDRPIYLHICLLSIVDSFVFFCRSIYMLLSNLNISCFYLTNYHFFKLFFGMQPFSLNLANLNFVFAGPCMLKPTPYKVMSLILGKINENSNFYWFLFSWD